ncbi:MAG: LEPR-XLL domain-containing protein, partial [Proteobacteria bacterium]|nr:LEPR-XLL domain-containing protein [Pseudomonadota bacterium]
MLVSGVWRWLKTKVLARKNDSSSMLEGPHSHANQYRLESLEPRLLLSADPLLGELARWAEDDGRASESEEIAAIVYELDLVTESEIASSAADYPPVKNSKANNVDWPKGWDLVEDDNASLQNDIVINSNQPGQHGMRINLDDLLSRAQMVTQSDFVLSQILAAHSQVAGSQINLLTVMVGMV